MKCSKASHRKMNVENRNIIINGNEAEKNNISLKNRIGILKLKIRCKFLKNIKVHDEK
jgi:hypothetical protein